MAPATTTPSCGKRAMITGITGQDGSYLAEYLLHLGYEVHGLTRKSSSLNIQRIRHLTYPIAHPHLFLHYGDLADSGRLTNLMYEIEPDEVYHLGAQSHVRVSFDMPESTGDITGLSTTRMLESLKRSGSKARFYQASSSELFGSALPPQNEETPFHPRSPYAAAKLYGYWMAINFREAGDVFACNGILFNHESPRRGESFVTRKITIKIAQILHGETDHIAMGYLDAKRDWGYAPEFVQAMHLMLQQDEANDYVIGTGETHSVREFLEEAFAYVGIDIEWRGQGVDEEGIIRSISSEAAETSKLQPGHILIRIDPWYFRPTEVDCLLADNTKAREKLGWSPRVTFATLLRLMIDCDMQAAGLVPPGDGLRETHEHGLAWTDHTTA